MHSLKYFYQMMHSTVAPRRRIASAILNNTTPLAEDIDILNTTLFELQSCCDTEYNATLALDRQKSIDLNLFYEVNELEKDLLFIQDGENALINHFRNVHQNFDKQIEQIYNPLHKINFHSFIADRDGTINNYCGRYLSSIQSVYNAVFVSRFAKKVNQPCILTSAPLMDKGLVDISTVNTHQFLLAGSKGREALKRDGQKINFEANPLQTVKHVELNHHIKSLLKDSKYEKFTYIGSGLQIKFGQTAIARQDISNSIDVQESLNLLKEIENILEQIDPKNEFFTIEDTGKDIEIHLTVNTSDSPRGFDKGDGLTFLNYAADMNLKHGPALVCGDTKSDAPIITACQQHTEKTHTIFVTEDNDLKDYVRLFDPKAIFVTQPDILIAALNQLAQQ